MRILDSADKVSGWAHREILNLQTTVELDASSGVEFSSYREIMVGLVMDCVFFQFE
jgi:hypothetical protein